VQQQLGLHNSEVCAGDDHDDMGGLIRDHQVMGRRSLLTLLGGLRAAGNKAACGGDAVVQLASSATAASPTTSSGVSSSTTPGSVTTTSALAADSSAISASPGAAIPSETAGPFPADGTNGPNALEDGAVIRRDITTSFGDYSGTAVGTPVSINLTIVDAATGSPIEGAAVYLWHCTAEGRYSIYEESDTNYLRGVQVADSAGRLTFDSIFPGCYRGRWPHCHFEVFNSLSEASTGRSARRVSQLALGEEDCRAVYADSVYGNSLSNLGQLSLSGDMVFRDGWADQLATYNPSAGSIDLLVRV